MNKYVVYRFIVRLNDRIMISLIGIIDFFFFFLAFFSVIVWMRPGGVIEGLRRVRGILVQC